MFLKTNSKQTPCRDFNLDPQRPGFSGLSENPIGAGDAVVTLFRDDGFPLFSCVVSDFSRVVYTNGTLTLTNEPVPFPQPEDQAKKRIAELKILLTSTDYQAIKYAEGLIPIAEYEPIKAQRQAWRNEINTLEKGG